MAGRPRTKLKRIRGWTQQAEALYDDIVAQMPQQYKNPHAEEGDLVANSQPNTEDAVACQWTAAEQACFELYKELTYLESAISERTGVYLPMDQARQDDSDEGAEATPEAAVSFEG